MLLPYKNVLKEFKIILGSQSTGRKGLLEKLDMFQFQVMPSNFEEDLDKSSFSNPEDYVKATCQGKVQDLLPRLQKDGIDWDILIFADTIMDLEGKIIEKPFSQQEAFEMIKELNGKWHKCHTCVNLVGRRRSDGQIIQQEFIETTEVEIGILSDEAIKAYSEQEDLWQGKSGGYSIQGKGSLLIKQIKGCYANIIGLPIYRFGGQLCNVLDFLLLK